MKKITGFFIVTALALVGCSNKDLYNISKENREQNCKMHVGAEREQCLQELNQKNYEQYEKERQQVLKGHTDK